MFINKLLRLSVDAPGNLRGTEIKQNTVKWEWSSSSGASKYEITVNGQVVDVTGNTSIKSYNLYAGEHRMSVRSVSHDGSKSSPSPTAKITTSNPFDYNNAGRSELVGGESSGSGSSGEFGAPEGVWGKEILFLPARCGIVR